MQEFDGWVQGTPAFATTLAKVGPAKYDHQVPLEGVEAVDEHAEQAVVLRERYAIQVKSIGHHDLTLIRMNNRVLMICLCPFGVEGP